MMDEIEERIVEFGRAAPDQRGECYGKTRIVQELEEHLADDRVLSFFLAAVADRNEYDLARVDILKILELWDPPTDELRSQVGQLLARLLPQEEDVLVQQWMGIAAGNFVGVPERFDAVAGLLADHDVDLAVRHNCLSAIERLRGSEKARETLRRLANDDEMGDSIRRILAAMASEGK
jgi:hypothetical protein